MQAVEPLHSNFSFSLYDHMLIVRAGHVHYGNQTHNLESTKTTKLEKFTTELLAKHFPYVDLKNVCTLLKVTNFIFSNIYDNRNFPRD